MPKKKKSKTQKASSHSKNLLRKQLKQRNGLNVVSLFIGIVVVSIFLLLITLRPSLEKMSYGSLGLAYDFIEVPTPTNPLLTPTPTPLIPSEEFTYYSQLSGEEKFAVAYNFTDPILKVSFAYPPGYYMRAIKAEKNEPYRFAKVFFAKNGNTDAIKGIQYAVDCELDNRKDPAGLCRESQVGDIEGGISPYKENASDFTESANCRREIFEKERVLLSCVEAMSIDMQDKGMRYTLYLLGENPVSVSLSVRDPKTHAHIIRSILSSVTNHAQ